MARVSLIFIFTWHVVFLNEIGLSLAKDECSSNSDCPTKKKICCAGSFYESGRSCSYNSCVGQYCSTDGDCGGVGECCKSNRCVTFGCQECYSNSNCSTSEYCCKHRYINDHNVCRRSCVGQTCHSNSDCGGPGEYFDSNNKCEKSNTATIAGWVTALIVVGVLLIAFAAGGVFVYRWLKTRSHCWTVVQPIERSPAIIVLQDTQNRPRPPAAVYNYSSPSDF